MIQDPNILLMEVAPDSDIAEPDGAFVPPKLPQIVEHNRQAALNGKHVNGTIKAKETLDETPAHDHDSERALLAAVLMEPGLAEVAFNIVRPASFHDDRNKKVCAAIHVLHVQGAPITGNAVFEVLAGRGHDQDIDKAWFASLLEEHAGTVHNEANTTWFANCVDRVYKLRMGRLALEQAIVEISKPGADGATVADAGFSAVRDLCSARESRPRFEVMTASELAEASFALDWIIAGVLVRWQNCIIAGVLKTCKTKLTCYLAYAIACGSKFLGKPVYQNLPVLLASAESGGATIKQNLAAIAEADGRELADVDGLHFCEQLPRLNNDKHIDEFQHVLERIAGGVVFLDPWYLMSGLSAGESANNSAAGDRLGIITDMANEHEITPVLVAHNRKPGKLTKEERQILREPPTLADISGAGLPEWARNWILAGRREPYQDNGVHDLWIRVGGSAGHSEVLRVVIDEGFLDGKYHPDNPMRFGLRVESASDAHEAAKEAAQQRQDEKSKEQLQEDCKAIVEAVSTLKRTYKTVVRDRVTISGGVRFKRAWNACIDEKHIVTDGTGKAANNHTVEFVCLPGQESQPDSRTQQDCKRTNAGQSDCGSQEDKRTDCLRDSPSVRSLAETAVEEGQEDYSELEKTEREFNQAMDHHEGLIQASGHENASRQTHGSF